MLFNNASTRHSVKDHKEAIDELKQKMDALAEMGGSGGSLDASALLNYVKKDEFKALDVQVQKLSSATVDNSSKVVELTKKLDGLIQENKPTNGELLERIEALEKKDFGGGASSKEL